MSEAKIETVAVVDARRRFSELLNRAAYGGVRVVITRNGKPLAELIPASGRVVRRARHRAARAA